jgi:hypothetical protein
MKDPKPFGAKSRQKFSKQDLAMIKSYLATPAGKNLAKVAAKNVKVVGERTVGGRKLPITHSKGPFASDMALTKAKEAEKNRRLAGKPKKK